MLFGSSIGFDTYTTDIANFCQIGSWGNRKGTISTIVERVINRDQTVYHTTGPFHVAPRNNFVHNCNKLIPLAFEQFRDGSGTKGLLQLNPGDNICLQYSVGAGGGHFISVSNYKLYLQAAPGLSQKVFCETIGPSFLDGVAIKTIENGMFIGRILVNVPFRDEFKLVSQKKDASKMQVQLHPQGRNLISIYGIFPDRFVYIDPITLDVKPHFKPSLFEVTPVDSDIGLTPVLNQKVRLRLNRTDCFLAYCLTPQSMELVRLTTTNSRESASNVFELMQ